MAFWLQSGVIKSCFLCADAIKFKLIRLISVLIKFELTLIQPAMPDGSDDPTPSDEPTPEDPCQPPTPPLPPDPPPPGDCDPPLNPPASGDDDETGGEDCEEGGGGYSPGF
jgi:hypothetical protein